MHVALQPIVDLQRGQVTGYEALSRFPGPPDAPPDLWFGAAQRHGCDEQLAACAIACALEARSQLTANCFLSINLEPRHLVAAAPRAALTSTGSLDGVVLELTEHAAIADPAELRSRLRELTGLGAKIAIDDVGAGYAGLQALLTVRPDLIKLDRSLVAGIDQDPAKRVLVRSLGELADSIDAWILAEGIETAAELDELIGLRVPLGQGYLLGRPQPTCLREIDPVLAKRMARRVSIEVAGATLAMITEPIAVHSLDTADDDVARPSVLVDEFQRPVRMVLADGSTRPATLRAKSSESVGAVAKRSLARPDYVWGDPIAVTDGRGTIVGIVRPERLLETLADEHLDRSR